MYIYMKIKVGKLSLTQPIKLKGLMNNGLGDSDVKNIIVGDVSFI